MVKVWGISLGKTRCIVGARSKTAAARALDCTLYTFNMYACETGNEEEIVVGLGKPGQVFMRPIDWLASGGWQQVDRWTVTP